jgi:hypothetical protein
MESYTYSSYKTPKNLSNIIKCQNVWRGVLFRKKKLPNSLYTIKNILKDHNIKLCNISKDGRVNSCIDENEIVKILLEEMPNRIFKPEARMWYDILVYDYIYNWIPVNIKTTTTLTSDNTGNLAMCVYAYTDEHLDLYKTYQNGRMSQILINKLKRKEYNSKDKRDYYFIVVNKQNINDIIVNSVKGLAELTPNINNIPFQVLWNKNREFTYKKIYENIKLLIDALQKPKSSWKETFMTDIRKITL